MMNVPGSEQVLKKYKSSQGGHAACHLDASSGPFSFVRHFTLRTVICKTLRVALVVVTF